MSRTRAFAALLAASLAANVAAEDDFTVVTKRSSQAGEKTELFVFVGEQLDYEPQQIDCGENCWVFDSWYSARYRVAQWIHGVPPGPELEFEVAEHAVLLPFGHSRYALVFVERIGDGLALVKNQQVPVYPTADGGFASCGPLWGGPNDRDEALDAGEPGLVDIAFSPRLVVDDARRLSAHGRTHAYDTRWHEVVGDEVLCRRGVPVAKLVESVVRGHDMLKARLPGLAGAAQ